MDFEGKKSLDADSSQSQGSNNNESILGSIVETFKSFYEGDFDEGMLEESKMESNLN